MQSFTQLSILTDENLRLQAKVNGLVKQLADVANVPPPPDRAISCDLEAQRAKELKSEAFALSPEKPTFEYGFNDSVGADSEDKNNPEFESPMDDGFGNSAFGESDAKPSTAPEGFGVFGEVEADDGFGNPFTSDPDGFGGEPGDFSDPFGAPDGLGKSPSKGFEDDAFSTFEAGGTMVSTFGDDGFGGTATDGFGDTNKVSDFGDGFDSTSAAQRTATDDGFGDPFGTAVEDDAFTSAVSDGFEGSSPEPANGFAPPPMLSERPKHGASTWDIDSSTKGQGDGDDAFGNSPQFDQSAAEAVRDDGFGQPCAVNDDGFGQPSATSDDGFGQPGVFTDDGFGAPLGDGFGDTGGTAHVGSDPFSNSGGDLGW